MGIVDNLTNKVALKVHELTYDPEAEKYAAEKAAALAAEKKAADDAAAKVAKEAADTKAEADAKAKAETDAAERESRSKFSASRMAGTVLSTIGQILLVFALFAGGIFGASLATNLNVYKSWPYRILYMIYGFLFFPITIIYVLGYRWFWQGKRPVFYSLIPLLPYHIDKPWLAYMFAWLSYRPDETIAALEEWRYVGAGAETAPQIPLEP